MKAIRTGTIPDPRHIANGWEIPTESYSDQPYVVRTDDGAWLCCVTTGAGCEGAPGQHVVTLRSLDQGRTWSAPVDVEPVDGPEASYAVMLKVPSGRVYVFYNHNTDRVPEVKRHDGKTSYKRVDSLGHFVFKYSDNHGQSWSAERYDIPIRVFACDRENVYGGKLCFFWNVGKPIVHGGAAFVSLHKVGKMGEGFFAQSEGVLLKSDNILTERDPAKLRWETLPDGDIGLRTPPGGGPVSEEQSYCVLSDGAFHVVYRSIDGYPVEAYSRDGGHTWTEPRYQRYADGRLMKHPRAANFAWNCSNGKFLYWFHNHGGVFIGKHPNATNIAYEDRNPVWLCGGEEIDTPKGREIRWSQPEIVVYDDDTYVRMSYPDLVEDGGKLYLTETQKDIARVHEIEPALLAGLWNQFTAAEVAQTGLRLNLPAAGQAMPRETAMPALPAFLERDHKRADYGTKDLRRGFTIDTWLEFADLAPGQSVLDTRDATGQGLTLQTTARGTVEAVLNDGRTENRWDCDPGVLRPGKRHHLVAIVDGGPKLILFVVDGVLCDGRESRQFGWGRFSPNLRHANGGGTARLGGAVRTLRVYDRALRVSEAIANHRAGGPA
ncbi:MAG: hypothetical protein A3K19_04045 [Lentisphaerae bacterium RIFOXYB12_FULL_65_16]|nr:MAG: hypothetical protein A3K18_08340 [Lentisphaerae bacterium RIFOXYA12_64_32]OGV84258.1 MAG: hypothetical protein A3K19_04045 [Lentisphaerae bacterium RIFOXYB12_FULL_65_16]